MKHAQLLQPIAPEAPCGPDLLLEDDPDFTFGVFDAEGRLPSDYFDIRSGSLFEADKTRLTEDLRRLEALLRRSRDLRVLVLQAKWQILGGQFVPFCDSVIAAADLLEAWPEALHPRMVEDEVDRQNALEELNTLAHVPAPLEQARLLEDRRIGPVSLRAFATGSGLRALRPGEVAGDAAAVAQALGSAENAEAVDALKARVDGVGAALLRLQRLCAADPRFPFTPKFDRLQERLAEISEMILAARADLGAGAPAAAAADPAGPAEALPDAPPAPRATAASPGLAPGLLIDSQAAARAALQAAETHLARHEPSSLALLLVTQARLLIGRPLIEALEMLLEREIDEAVVDFGSQRGFRMPISRLRSLTEEVAVPHGVMGDAAAPPEVASRDAAGAVLKAVEDFYRRAEPASPIPILLFKARNLLGKDFHGILRELLPEQPDS